MILMSDLLSASSLLMAIAAILFSLWYGDISKALEISPKVHREDNVGAKKSVSNTIYSKALPVAIMALLVALIFLPDAIRITKESLSVYFSNEPDAFQYEAVKTAYCFVTLLSAALACYMWILVWKLFVLRNKLS